MTTLAAFLDATDVTTDLVTTPAIPAIATYLGVLAGDQPVLKAQYAEGIGWCDGKLSGRDFTADPPALAILAVYAYVKAVRDIDARASTGIKKTKTAAREEEYGDVGMDTYLTPGRAAWSKLEQLALDPTLYASGGS